MKKPKIDPNRRCPKCDKVENQINRRYNRSGTQCCMCKECGTAYTNNPKSREYSEEEKTMALKIYYSGVSGRGVGKIMGMNKANVYRWIKKNWICCGKLARNFGIGWVILVCFHKPRTKTRENVYVMTAVSRKPRQIVGFDVAYDKSPQRIQNMIDSALPASIYYTDGFLGYIYVVYPGKHIRNASDKSNTFTVEGVNADLRHYIPILARRSRCFARKLETLKAVLDVFVDAYNRFGTAKHKYRQTRKHGEIPFWGCGFSLNTQ